MKNTTDMKTFLAAQMQAVVDGSLEGSPAKSICNFAQQHYNQVNLELKYAMAYAKYGEALEIKPVDFGA